MPEPPTIANSPQTPALALLSTTVIYTAFALTGFGTALLGATLPVMLARWSLNDSRGGTLFLVLFLGSSTGAVVSRGRPANSLTRGAALLTLACAALASASGRAIFPLCFLYGLGLGITITSISLLQSQRRTVRIREMNRLNLVWSGGAFLCPSLANLVLRLGGVHLLFLSLGLAFASFTVWMLLAEASWQPTATSPLRPPRPTTSRLPLLVALMTLLATGLESSTGAWIATYAERLRGGFEAPVVVASVFWFGLLASRALHSTPLLHCFTERQLLRISASIAASGSILLIACQGQALLLIAGLLIGFGVGPIYPMLLAAVLPRISGNAIFVIAGLGGTILPWLTGTLSTHSGSLRIGLVVPAAAGLTLLACALRKSQSTSPIAR